MAKKKKGEGHPAWGLGVVRRKRDAEQDRNAALRSFLDTIPIKKKRAKRGADPETAAIYRENIRVWRENRQLRTENATLKNEKLVLQLQIEYLETALPAPEKKPRAAAKKQGGGHAD